MNYIKINETTYPAVIWGKNPDTAWGGRESKAVTLAMSYAEAAALFVDGLEWSIVTTTTQTTVRVDAAGNAVLDENGEAVTDTREITEEFDNSEFYVAGPITDNRDGTITVKMGKPTDGEMLAELMEVLSNE